MSKTLVPKRLKSKKELAYLEHISASSILLAYDWLERPVAPLSGASRPASLQGDLDNDFPVQFSSVLYRKIIIQVLYDL